MNKPKEELTTLASEIERKFLQHVTDRLARTEQNVAALKAELEAVKKMWNRTIEGNQHLTAMVDNTRAELEQAREALRQLVTAAEMHRAWEVHSSEDFNEMYPDEEGWAHGDVDENLLQGIEKARAALKQPEVE